MPPSIVAHATRLLTDEAAYRSMATAKNPYGDGHAAERIVERIRRYFASQDARDAPKGADVIELKASSARGQRLTSDARQSSPAAS